MQRLAPSLMPATRYVSKQLADWSVLDQGETADRRGSHETFTISEGNPPGIGVRAIEQGHPIRTAPRDPVLKF